MTEIPNRLNTVSLDTLLDSDKWELSVGKKVGKLHFRRRDSSAHAVCNGEQCHIHYDDHNPHDGPVEAGKHLLKDAPDVLASAAAVAVTATAATGLQRK